MSQVAQPTTTPAPFWRPEQLAVHASAPALVAGDERVSHGELARRVAQAAQSWPGAGERRLVLVELEASVPSVVTYLAALEAGHVVLVAAPGRADALADAWQPDDRAARLGEGWVVRHGAAPARHELHPDLAVLMSTSGSTGSPKLVRLSAEGVRTNALDIAAGLGLHAGDRGATTLPLHYCYGLSVLHAHLAVGGSVLLTRESVVDPSLWAAMREAGVTSLAAVPHTFELLESSGAPTASVPTLRQVTQAGGRLAPAQVRAWARRGRAEGWDLRVMYGQTEATARMTITRAGRAVDAPARVGSPVGTCRVRVCDTEGRELTAGEVGELHVTGASVMLGYAIGPGDLARGRDVTELATGDLARIHRDGEVEIVGRRSSFLKIAGVRLDVERVEESLAEAGLTALVGGSDERLLALVAAQDAPEGSDAVAQRATRALTVATGLPAHRVGVATVPALPRHASGKPDRAAVAPTVELLAATAPPRPHGSSAEALVTLYADLLGRPEATPDSTFVDLGGDSLSYVELSLHLEERLGALPADWPLRPIRTLATQVPPPRRRFARVDSSIALRAVAILAIVGSHTHVVHVLGGAHVLLGVAGYNFARFAASAPTAGETWRRVGGTVARIAVPTALWVAVVGVLAGTYSVANLAMVNWLFGSDTWSSTWRLWFVEALVWTLLGFAVLLSVPPVRRLHHRAPFALATSVAVLGAFARLDVFHLTSPPGRGTAPAVLWLVAIGWAAQVATTRRQRLLLSALVVAVLPGFMDDPVREATIAAGLLLLVWVPVVLVPRVLVPVLAALASASLYIYLTHFEVYRSTDLPWLNFALGIGVGLLAWLVATRAGSRLGSRLHALHALRARRGTARGPASPPVHPPTLEVPR